MDWFFDVTHVSVVLVPRYPFARLSTGVSLLVRQVVSKEQKHFHPESYFGGKVFSIRMDGFHAERFFRRSHRRHF